MPLQRGGSLYKPRMRIVVCSLDSGGLSFPPPETPRSTATSITQPPSSSAASRHPAPVPLLALNPGILFFFPRERPLSLTSAVTSLPHREEGAGMRSQGKKEEIPSPAGFSHTMQICLNEN